jgi:hypothetical protein
MRCEQFEDRLQLLLDQRRVPERDTQLVAHAQVCPPCREFLSIQTHLFDALDLADVPQLPESFARDVVAQVRPPVVVQQPSSGNRIAPILLAIAASLLLGLFSAAVIWMSSRGKQMAHDNKEISPNVESPATADVTDGDNWWRLSRSSLATLYPSDVRQRHREQVETIADELRPITTPFTTAATALRRTIPVGKTRSEGQPQAGVPTTWPRELS